MISSYALEALPLSSEGNSSNWEQSSIRKWLNNDFLQNAFSDEERDNILETKVDNTSIYYETYEVKDIAYGIGGKKNPNYGKLVTKTRETLAGPDTYDKVFLLSCAEAEKYMGVTSNPNEKIPHIQLTKYGNRLENCWTSYGWLLRSVSAIPSADCVFTVNFFAGENQSTPMPLSARVQ